MVLATVDGSLTRWPTSTTDASPPLSSSRTTTCTRWRRRSLSRLRSLRTSACQRRCSLAAERIYTGVGGPLRVVHRQELQCTRLRKAGRDTRIFGLTSGEAAARSTAVTASGASGKCGGTSGSCATIALGTTVSAMLDVRSKAVMEEEPESPECSPFASGCSRRSTLRLLPPAPLARSWRPALGNAERRAC